MNAENIQVDWEIYTDPKNPVLRTALRVKWSEENEAKYLAIVEAWANSLFNENMIFEMFLNHLINPRSKHIDAMQEALWLIVENINFNDTLEESKVCIHSWQRDVCDHVWAARCEQFGVYKDGNDNYCIRVGSELHDMIKANQAE